MTPDEFIRKWQNSSLKERSAAQEHFIDLCNLLDEPTPGSDASGADYAFERGAIKTTGAGGWADVWKRGCFGWEYKGKGKELNAALAQLQQYALALNNPPLLIVCDFDRIRIRTNWTNTVSEVHEISLEDLRDADKRQILKWAISDPERLKPTQTRQQLTENAAGEFAILAQRLAKDHDSLKVAHFINRMVFCMFAEDVGLLPDKMFEKMLRASLDDPSMFQDNASDLFRAMAHKGGKRASPRLIGSTAAYSRTMKPYHWTAKISASVSPRPNSAGKRQTKRRGSDLSSPGSSRLSPTSSHIGSKRPAR